MSELNDVSATYPAVAAELLKEIETWVTGTQAPVPNIPNPKFCKSEHFNI